MKKSKTIYWITTGLFAAFMMFSSIPDIMNVPDAVVFMTHLGYPTYFTPFIGWMKILGIIAILIPGFPKIKEWAYAGLFFDLFGAVYSMVCVEGLQAGMLIMLLPIVFLFVSRNYFHKLNAMS